MGSCYLEQSTGRWCIKYKRASGRTVRIRTHAQRREDAEQLLHQALLNADWVKVTGTPRPEPSAFRALWAWWEEHYLKRRVDWANVQRQALRHVLPHIGDLFPGELTALVLERAWAPLKEPHPTTYNALRSIVRTVVRDAAANGRWFCANPTDAVRRAKIPKTSRRTLTLAELRALIVGTQPPERGLLTLPALIGTRPGELFALRRQAVDMAMREVTISRSHERSTTKTGNPRTLPLPPGAWALLVEHLQAVKGALLFPTARGLQRRRDDSEPIRLLRATLARLGIEAPKIRYYDLRHTWTSLAMEAGVARELRQFVIGHIGDTTTIYEHWSREALRAELAKVDPAAVLAPGPQEVHPAP